MLKKDLIRVGMKFNELTVLAIDERNKSCTCRCSCDKETTVRIYDLISENTKSCGHLKHNPQQKKMRERLLNREFGNLTVVSIDENKQYQGGKHLYYICKCGLCGQTKSVRSCDLTSGRVVDCGCNKSKRISNGQIIDLSNKEFGHLKVLEKDNCSNQKPGTHARWVCKCNLCGRTESVSSAMLLQYGKDRCKICAGISMGEKKIYEILTENNIPFIHDKPYLDCKCEDTGGYPRFDFRINQFSDCDYMIEFDGEQHYKPIPMYDNSLSFESRIKRDRFKNQWCKDHNIPMIRIPYTRLKKLSLDDLRLQTTNYLIK